MLRVVLLSTVVLLAGCGGSDGDGAASGEPPRLTVAEAVDSGAAGAAIVRGTLFDDGAGLRLCAAIAESYPPQCGGASLRVEGKPDAIEWQEAQGVRWTDREVELEGELRDGVLTLS